MIDWFWILYYSFTEVDRRVDEGVVEFTGGSDFTYFLWND